MFLLVNGSQKNHQSNSEYFLKYISKYLKAHELISLKDNKIKRIIKSLHKAKTIILAFPLYVDSPNTITLNFFDYIIDHKIELNNKNIYLIINCGFREGKHNITALNIVKNWCNKTNINYMGALLIGAGEVVGKQKFKFISHKAMKDIDNFTQKIKNNAQSKEIITTMDLLNNYMYCLIANHSWKKQAFQNNLRYEDIIQE